MHRHYWPQVPAFQNVVVSGCGSIIMEAFTDTRSGTTRTAGTIGHCQGHGR